MLLQGIWAITAIRDFNPEFEIGTFALPMDDPDDTKLVSGVDVALTMPKEPAHPEESLALIEYLMRPEVVDKYVTDQAAIPTLTGVLSEDPALEGLLPYFEDERLVGFTDHQIPRVDPVAADQPVVPHRRQPGGLPVDARQRVGQVRRPSTRTGRPMKGTDR